MDELDRLLLTAWNRVTRKVRRDRLEAHYRAMRRHNTTYTRPARAWCLALRASDTRLEAHGYVNLARAPELREPHTVTLFSETIRRLTAPVSIDWPGIDACRAADLLGCTPRVILRRAARAHFRIRRYPARSVGKRGLPVPFVWSPTPIDPNTFNGRAPDPHWGTLWQCRHERIKDGTEVTLARVPRYSTILGRPHFVGWSWVCPGRYQRLPGPECETSVQDSEPLLPTDLPPIAEAERTLRLALDDDPDRPALRRPDTAKRTVIAAGRQYLHTPCGRLADKVYLPLRPWTFLDALGGPDPLGDISLPMSMADRLDGPPDLARLVRTLEAHSAVPGTPGDSEPMPDLSPDPTDPFPPFACQHCHRITHSSINTNRAWNNIISALSAGLLYGHEVPIPPGYEPVRRRRFAPRARPAKPAIQPATREERHQKLRTFRPRTPLPAQVLRALATGRTYRQIAADLGLSYHCVHSHVRRLYRAFDVHSRAELLSAVSGKDSGEDALHTKGERAA